MNYHQKQKQNNSFKSSIKKFNNIGELDTNVNSFYLYCPPTNHKSNSVVKHSEQHETARGIIVFDYDQNNKLCGIEITDAAQHIDLQGLGIQSAPKNINREEVDGNR